MLIRRLGAAGAHLNRAINAPGSGAEPDCALMVEIMVKKGISTAIKLDILTESHIGLKVFPILLGNEKTLLKHVS